MQLLQFLIFMLLFLLGHLASSWFAVGQTLPKSEVDTLKEIGRTLGKDWDFTVDPCSEKPGWFTRAKKIENAVTCNCNTNTLCHVVSIVLKSQNLPGVLPPELAKLPFLEEIDLTRNYLNGTIPPEWGSLKLVNISLGGNRLSGSIPVELTRISTLTTLTLDMNQLNGSLPKEFGNLFNIEKVVLSSNNFTGELPQTLANLTNLKDFRISDNNFTGKIPNFIENWTKLERLELQATGLEGPIPPGITLLSNLTDLRISDLNGPETAFPQLSSMKQMKTLILRRCNITGGIPSNLSSSEVTNMKNLDLSFNKLTGEIPRDFDVWSKTDHMYFTGNALTGFVPEWILARGEGIDLSYNNFTPRTPDVACPEQDVNLFRSFSVGNNLHGVDPCLRSIRCPPSNDLSYNNFTPRTPDVACPEQDVNLFRSFSVGNNLHGVDPCLRSIRCPPNLHSFHINCGGQEIVINKTKYGEDKDPGDLAKFFFRGDYFWASSSTGNFMDNDDDTDNYKVSNTSELSMKDSQLYMTARTSPLSYTYYGFCLMNGNYTVKLHFAEIIFTNDRTYNSLGRRLFDVYIQGKRVLTDFNIENEAGSVGKELLKIFPAVPVTNSTLEIRFYWAGKGTTGIPTSGFYGPLISAISVDSDFFVPSETEKMSAGVVAGIVLSALSLIIMVLGILWLKGCLGQKSSYDKELRGLDLQTGSFTLRQIKAATNNFDDENKIGEGGFGSVYKGLLADGTIVAVKQLSSKSKQGNREFVNEIGMISALQHPHLVKLHGCCIEGNQLLLIYEYLENNSLARALFGPEECQLELDWPTRHKICVGIARGLAFLHEESRLKIVHRDIKATNILLDKDLNPKISDFGLAKLDEEDSTHISTRIAGTFGYMAPEYAMRGYLTDKADVYSFGVVALEIVSGRSNSNHKAKKECVYLLDWALVLQEKGNLMELVDPRLGSNYKKEEVLATINVALSCTNASPTLRPIMSSVVSMLEGRTVVHEFVSDPEADMKFKAIENKYQVVNEDSIADIQAHSIPVDAQWSESSTSALDLYPLNPNSEYWRNRV